MSRRKSRKQKLNLRRLSRQIFHDTVLEADNYICQGCGRTNYLTAHHIKKRSQGGDDSVNNGLTLCWYPTDGCHQKVEGQIKVEGMTAREYEISIIESKIGEPNYRWDEELEYLKSKVK